MGGMRTVVCGRKFCTRCKRWRHVVDFHAHGRRPDGYPSSLQARCMTCMRVYVRERDGYQPRRWGSCMRGHPRTPENVGVVYEANGQAHRYCRACKREVYAEKREKREFMERKREYQRFWTEAKRRERGARPRQFGPRSKRAPDGERTPKVPAAPFREWLLARRHKYDSLVDMAVALGVDESVLRKVLAGEKPTLYATTVDRALTNEGNTLWWELYDDEEMAA